MPRTRSPDRDKAFEIYKEHKGDIDLVEIAKILNRPEGTIRGWKNKDKWKAKLNGTFQKNKERSKREKQNNKKEKKPVVKEVESLLENTDLTDKQRLFCIYHVKYFNATKAYQKSYGCSYNTAMVNGFNLLRNTKIKEEIEKLKRHKLNRAMLSEDDIFQKYIDIAFADITDYVEFGNLELPVINKETGEEMLDDNGETVKNYINFVNFKNNHQVDGTIISEVSKGKNGVKIKLQDKMKALDWLSERLDLLPTDTKEKLSIEKEKVKLLNEKLDLEKDKANGTTKDIEDLSEVYGDIYGNK